MRSQFLAALYSGLFLIIFSIADSDVDPHPANYAPLIISLDDEIEEANFDSDPDQRTSNSAPPSDQRDGSSFAAPMRLSDAKCSQGTNGELSKGQLMQICPSYYPQTSQGGSTGHKDGQQAPIVPQRIPDVTKLGKLERNPTICPYLQRQVPVCSRSDAAVLVGSTYVLIACSPYDPIIGCEKPLLEELWCCLSAMWRTRYLPGIRADPNLKRLEYEGVWCLPEGGLTIPSPL